MWRLRTYLYPYWKSSLLAPLLMVLEVAMDLLQPLLMASIVNEGIMKGDLPHIQRTGLLMITVALIGLIGGVGCSIFASIASQSFGKDLRNDLFRRTQRFSFRNLDELKPGSLITRLTNDVVQLQTFVQMILRAFVRSPLLLIGSLVMAIAISLKLTLILAISIPLLMVILYVLIRASLPLFTNVQAKLDGVNTVLQENLSGIRVVKAFVRAGYERSRFAQANHSYTQTAIKAARVIALNMPLMTLILNVSIVAVLWYGGLQHWDGDLAVGSLIAFINYVTQLLMAMLGLSSMLTFVSRAKVSADRVQEVFAKEPEITDEPHPVSSAIQAGGIEFQHVSYAYEDDLALRDISFKVAPGQTLAILGATGSGKSTLIHLIPRLFDVTSGRILIDGVDVRQMELAHLRREIGMVLQQAVLFSGTIRDNIRFGHPSATLTEIEAAAMAAQAHDFIVQLPDGYDTILGQKGVNLSGGQKQRLSIARTLLLNPKILILDDSTSAVDLGTESRIQLALRQRMQSSTNVIIAHRISSVIDADQILVLDNGSIAAMGTHEELLRSSPIYKEIYQSQWNKEGIPHV